MGATASSLLGRCKVHDALLPYTVWDYDKVKRMVDRHQHDLGGCFALSPHQFMVLVGEVDMKKTDAIFYDVFDTDKNNLVDAYEIIGSITVISDMQMEEKVKIIHALYDFNGSGDITMDEMTILMRTLAVGCSKMDARVPEPSTQDIEALTKVAFRKADKDQDGEIGKTEFDVFCGNSPLVKEFLKFWDGGLSWAVIPPGEFFQDPDFGANAKSLYKDAGRPPKGMPPTESVQWLRPSEFCPKSPSLFMGGISAGDVCQGQLGNCWFISALAVMAARPQFLKALFVATGQEDKGRYCVRFFKDGDWVNVYIDDRIPCDVLGRPLFCHGKDPNEIWMMLVEKAYAKLHGCYENLISGFADYALMDMTGGAVEKVLLDGKDFPKDDNGDKVWGKLQELEEGGFLGVSRSIRPKKGGNQQVEAELADAPGILQGHAYSLLEVREVEKCRLIKIRNPWGRGEWKGDWSDKDVMWEDFPKVAEELKPSHANDGTFWMAVADFARVFNTIYACRIFDESEWTVKRREATFPAEGGGCVKFKSWVSNPQFALELKEETELHVSVSQPDARYHVHRGPTQGKYDKGIGFIVVEHDWGDKEAVRQLKKVSKKNMKVVTLPFKPAREISRTHKLPAGKYMVVPMTFKQNKPGEYWVSVHGNKPFELVGGEEVVWGEEIDDVVDDDDDAPEDDDFAEHEPEDEDDPDDENDQESLATERLHEMVSQMMVQAQQLLKRKQLLQMRVQKLEAAKAPTEATPVEAAPAEAAPVEVAPVEAAPVETTPVSE